MPDDRNADAGDADEVLGTMQLPRGAQPEPPKPRDARITAPDTIVRAPDSADRAVDSAATPVDVTLRPASGDSMPAFAPPAMPEPGGRYALGDEIARGGMGRVVEATDTLLGRTVAFKEALSNDPDALRRFARETRITARLEHPSIVPVHDAGVSPNGAPFYVMRKIGGQPLEQLVGAANTLQQRLALIPHIVASARAIAHAHERGIVHRDIKPSNILAGELGETIVIDWGLAKVIGEVDDAADVAAAAASPLGPLHTRAGVVFGTPGFMSPEQLRGAPVDEQCDVYALGATLYHLLARRPPHYAKTADEMMRAAVAAPPTPVSELVPGVPPELETIVGKALAQTAEARYRSSRELAEDLQRFLTGQLVAAHRYSRKERFARFLRLHRVELSVALLALVAMAVLSAGFVHKILAERDRADMEAREAIAQKKVAVEQTAAATDRANLLLLDHARELVGTNPSAAIALLGPLAGSPKWPQVRAIGAAARAAGVAYALPASPHTQQLAFAHDGTHLIATGSDGVVRVHDLAARTTRTIADTHHPALARFSDDDQHIVIASGAHVTIADATGKPVRELDAAQAIATLEVAGTTAYWVDATRAGWALDLVAATAAPIEITSPEPLERIVPSPDGAWLAVLGAQHLYYVDRSATEPHLVSLIEAHVKAIAWAADSSEFMALLDNDVLRIATGVPTRIIDRHDVGRVDAVAMIGDTAYVLGPTGVTIPTRDGNIPHMPVRGYALGLAAGPDGALVAGSVHGTLAVKSPAGDPVLAVPSGGLTSFAASPQSTYVVGASDGAVLVWNLADVLPRPLTTAAPSAAELVDDDHVLAAYPYRAAQWIDLRKSTLADAGELASVSAIVPAPDGASAAILDLAHALSIVTAAHEPIAVATDVARAAYLGDGRLAYATSVALVVRDAAGHGTALAGVPGAPTALATRGTWLAAAYGDGAIWRVDTASGRADHVATGEAAPHPIALAPDGTVLVAVGSELRAWRASGELVVLAQLPHAIRAVHAMSATRAIALSESDAYGIDDSAPLVTMPLTGSAAVADDAGLVVVRSSAGVLEVIDAFAGPRDGVRWTLARATDVMFSAPHVTRDGRRVLAGTANGLVVWSLDLPATADATATWLAALTAAAR